MKIKTAFLLISALTAIAFIVRANNNVPDQKLLYKVIGGDSLYLHVFKPEESNKPTAAIVFFFGGGWVGGSPVQFYQQSQYFASRGMLAISADYRTENKYGTTPFDCVEDAKSAIRWVRQHASELNVDPDKIVGSGGSAGGHVAICTALISGLENSSEDLIISSVPNAMVGYNPVFDTTEKGYGHDKVVGKETEISPCHQVKKDMPPMLNFHGTKDGTVPFENAERFTRLMNEVGNDCELVAIEGADHGFFNGNFFRKGVGDKLFNLCMYDTDIFLKKLGFIKGKPTVARNLIKVACVGDSNTQSKYPEYLQNILGYQYQVKNFGRGAATILDSTLNPYHKIDEYKMALKFSPDIVLLMLGTNDANPRWCHDNTLETDFIGTPQEEFKTGYIQLINDFKKVNQEVQVKILTPLPVWAKKNPENKNMAERKEQLHLWVIPTIWEIAKEQNLPVIDINTLMQDSYEHSKEGLHYTDQGYNMLAKKIAKNLNK